MAAQNRAVVALYGDGIGGIPGNDDAGAQSSVYIWRALGIFPVAGRNIYLINGPVELREATVDTGFGRTLRIVAYGQDDGSAEKGGKEVGGAVKYVQRVVLNRAEWENSWFRHSDIEGGAVLEVWLGDEPGNWAVGGELTPRF